MTRFFTTVFALAILLTTAAVSHAQNLQNCEAAYQENAISGALNKKSEKRDKLPIQQFGMKLEHKNRVLVELESTTVPLMAEIWMGDRKVGEAKAQKVGNKWTLRMHYKAKATDFHSLLVTSTDPKAEGTFSGQWTREDAALSTIGFTSGFCDKMNYLLTHHFHDYNMLRSEKPQVAGKTEKHVQPKFKLQEGQANTIVVEGSKCTYEAVMIQGRDKEKIMGSYAGMQRKFNECLGQHGKIQKGGATGKTMESQWIEISNSDNTQKVRVTLSMIDLGGSYRVTVKLS